jgi:uncharacterized protein YfdQ (DUF2303 family)
MTFTVEAIREMQESHVVEQANRNVRLMSGDKSAVIALPDRYSTHDLEKFLPLRRRARGRMSTTAMRDFVAYSLIHREPGATIFIDANKMRAVGVLNLGQPDAAGHADNQAVLELEQTAAYKALRQACSGHKSQATLAEFLEDWPDAVQAFAGTEQLAAPKAIAAIRKITIESLRKLESEEQQLSATRSAFESVAATSTEKLPTHLYFNCVPYAGLSERQFVLRLQIHTGDKAPSLSLRMANEELHAEQMAQELCALLRSQCQAATDVIEAEPMQVLIGSYSAAA